MLLDDADTRALLEAATRLAADPVPGFAAVLGLLTELIPCTSASFNDMAFATGDFRYLIAPPDNEDLARRLKPAYDRFAHQHPLIGESRRRLGYGALRFCDVAEAEHFTSTDLYLQFYRPFGLRYQLVIELPSPPDVVVGYALNRSPEEGEFSDRDVAVLNSFRGHLAMHHRVVMDLERARAMTVEADRDGWVVLTVRSDGIIEAASSSALSPLLTAGRAVPAEVAALLPTFPDLGTQAATHDLAVGDERWRCVVHPVPFGPTVLLVRRLGTGHEVPAPLVDLGLTRRQIDVAIALADTGGTNAQLARSLDISEGTVKKHLETVFRALRVDNRAAAAVALRELVG